MAKLDEVTLCSIPLTYYDPPITLHSDGRSHWFVDGVSIFHGERLRELVLDCWEKELRRIFPATKLFHFIGVPRGGLQWAEAIAKRFEQAICGAGHLGVAVGYTLVAVDDVLTTGASIKEVKDAKWALVVVARAPAGAYFPATTAWAKIDLPLLEEE